jgi:hypothetical protein
MSEGSKEIRLSHPITVNKTKTDILTLRRMKVKDLKLIPQELWDVVNNKDSEGFKLSGPVLSDMVPFLASLADITTEEADELDLDDLNALVAGLEGILGK